MDRPTRGREWGPSDERRGPNAHCQRARAPAMRSPRRIITTEPPPPHTERAARRAQPVAGGTASSMARESRTGVGWCSRGAARGCRAAAARRQCETYGKWTEEKHARVGRQGFVRQRRWRRPCGHGWRPWLLLRLPSPWRVRTGQSRQHIDGALAAGTRAMHLGHGHVCHLEAGRRAMAV